MTDLKNMSVASLRALAKEMGLKGTSGLRKNELIQVIETSENNKTAENAEQKKITTPAKVESRTLQKTKDTSTEETIKMQEDHRENAKSNPVSDQSKDASETQKTDSRQNGRENGRRQNNNNNNNGRRQNNNARQNNNEQTGNSNARQSNNEQAGNNNRRQNNNSRQNNNEQNDNNDRRQNNNEQAGNNDRRQNNNRRNNNEQTGNDRRQNNNYRQNNEEQTGNERRQNNNSRQNNNEQSDNGDRRQARRAPMSQERMDSLDSGEMAKGILEINQEGGYGFIRGENYLTCENDIYVANTQIRRFNLKTGDYLEGPIRVSQGNEKFQALLYISRINGEEPENARKRVPFEKLTPIFPDERLQLETEGCSNAMRIMNLFAPIGKGQRGMIVSPPKAGKTTLLKDVANAVKTNHPEVHIIILLIDERPEEVTDIKESIVGDNVEVIHSTFDELPSHHTRVAEMVLDRGRRLVEQGKDCMILLDSITRLTRAYNLTEAASGRTLSGGLDPAALHMPKKFFGAARNIRDGGSLTILATALVDTGSRMDDVVFEEFKGTGNMEIVLDRKMSERRIFPAIDLMKSGTRRDDLLLNAEEQEAMANIRRQLVMLNPEETTEQVLRTMEHTHNNTELVEMLQKLKAKAAPSRNIQTVMREQNRTLK